MNILQVTNKVPYPTKDGGAIACMNLTKGFAHLGHAVTVLAMNTEKHHTNIEEIPEILREMATFHFVDVPASINIYTAFVNLIFSNKPYNAVRFIDKKFGKELARLLQVNAFDVVQLEGLYLCPYIPLIRKYTKATLVYRAHNIEHEIWERAEQMGTGFRKLYFQVLAKRIKRFEIRMLNTYDLLVPITARDGEILDALGNKKKKHISQTGIDSSELIPNAKHLEFPSLFHIGSLEWAPNQEGLLWFVENCWPIIHKKFPDLTFYVAGRNAPPTFRDKLKLKNIIFEGEVKDAYAFMNSKAIMIVPLFSGSGMRIKIVEGMALGKAIVTTPVGAEGINVSHGKNIFIAEDVRSFCSSVARLVENRQLVDNVGSKAIDFIDENFDNLEAANRLVEFYKQNVQ